MNLKGGKEIDGDPGKTARSIEFKGHPGKTYLPSTDGDKTKNVRELV